MTNMNKIGIIINPYAKINKNNIVFINRFKELFQAKALIKITHSIEDIKGVATEFLANQIDILAINGGDGTISKTLNVFYEQYRKHKLAFPKIALLKGGTINVLATNLKIKAHNPITIFNQLLQQINFYQPLKVKRYTSLIIENNLGFLFADGVAFNFLNIFYRNKTNAIGSIILFINTIGSYLVKGNLASQILTSQAYEVYPKPYSKIYKNSMMLCISTLDKFPFGIPIFPSNSSNNVNKLKMSLIFIQPKLLLFKIPMILINNREGEYAGKIYLNCDEILINIEKLQKCFYNYSLDGDLYQTTAKQILIRKGPEFDFILI